MSKKAVIYTRITPIERQYDPSNDDPNDKKLKLLRDYAVQEGFDVVQEFAEALISKQIGPVFEEMVAFLRGQEEVRTVIVEDADILNYSMKNRVTIDGFINELGVEIRFVEEGPILSRDSRSSEEKLLDGRFWLTADGHEMDKAIKGGAKVDIYDEFELTPLHYAVKRSKSKEAVARLLDENPNIEARARAGNTPLLLASSFNDSEIIELLLDKGADVNARKNDEETPLHLAALSNEPEVVALLLDRGADIRAYTRVHPLTPLHFATGSNNLEVVNLLLDRGADIHASDESGISTLHEAAKNNTPEMVAFLLDRGVDIEARDSDGDTPLHRAAGHNTPEVVALLLDRGADITVRNEFRWTILDSAVWNGKSPEVIALLLDRGADADIKIRDSQGRTPLHCAVVGISEAPEMIKMLLDKGADINAHAVGGTPLHFAASHGKPDVITLLLDRGANIESRTREAGRTPLHDAAEDNTPEVVALLLDKGADIKARSSTGLTPLHLAAVNNKPEVVALLLDMGAPIEVREDTLNATPLDFAANNEHLKGTSVLERLKATRG